MFWVAGFRVLAWRVLGFGFEALGFRDAGARGRERERERARV